MSRVLITGGTGFIGKNLVNRLIADGHIVAWFQGGSEYGPRALGHRSILADSRSAAIKDLVNDRSVTRRSGGSVTYVHLMFDRHQVIYSEGIDVFESCLNAVFVGPPTGTCPDF